MEFTFAPEIEVAKIESAGFKTSNGAGKVSKKGAVLGEGLARRQRQGGTICWCLKEQVSGAS